jgi:hypothetical protein
MMTFSELFRKNLLACLLGPLAIVPASALYALGYKLLEPTANEDQSGIVPMFILFGLLVAYPMTILVGLPISLLLQRICRFNLFYLLSASFFVVAGYTLFVSGSFSGFLFILYYSTSVAWASYYFYRLG